MQEEKEEVILREFQKLDLSREISNTMKGPHNLDAERFVLGAILTDSNSFENVSAVLQASDFYSLDHATVFECMAALNISQKPITTVTLLEKLTSLGKITKISPSLLFELESLGATPEHVEDYSKIIRDKSVLRKLISASSHIYQLAHKQEGDVFDIVDAAEKAVTSACRNINQAEAEPLNVLVQRALTRIANNSGMDDILGIRSGFKEFDRLTNGLQPGELIVIAARPSMGKTAFTLNIAIHVALRLFKPVAFFSLEMGAEQLVYRLVGSEALIDLSSLRRGALVNSEYQQMVAAAGDIGQSPLFIDETAGLSISEMRSKCRRLVNRQQVQLIIVDYLQLMTTSISYENKATEVAEISKGLKSIARELKVPVIALSQLNRSVESRVDKRPMMSDLRESGAIEQDADIVAFLYREEYYLRDKTPEEKRGIAEVIISKNRNGPTGSLELKFFNHITRFANLDYSHL